MKNSKDRPMWEVEKEVKFEAAHFMPNYNGPCRNVHGHSWRVRVVLRLYELHEVGPLQGMSIDFGDIKGPLENYVVHALDHGCLNNVVSMDEPSCEVLARWIFEQLEKHAAHIAVHVYKVVVHETSVNTVSYYPKGA